MWTYKTTRPQQIRMNPKRVGSAGVNQKRVQPWTMFFRPVQMDEMAVKEAAIIAFPPFPSPCSRAPAHCAAGWSRHFRNPHLARASQRNRSEPASRETDHGG